MVPAVSRSGRVVCHGKFSVIMLSLSLLSRRRRRASENDFAFIVVAGRNDGIVCTHSHTHTYTRACVHVSDDEFNKNVAAFQRGPIDKRLDRPTENVSREIPRVSFTLLGKIV